MYKCYLDYKFNNREIFRSWKKKEINTLKSSASDHRKILKDYNEEIINQMIMVVQSCTIV
ncbi:MULTISPECIES: hypothetical protein [Romboutsia]|uniref:hypothetical protein n=1 Tax=Romboutsia TaxID=1501226 RepID=UPI001412420E|nr:MULTISPECIES: hypothetical protein [Romboutsia]MDB8789343.1 hypothetical protein [Romboutsia sp. 1001216sp1]MDB8792724.1 hypothetical protein [Romboutsia sp. 1001216sp1]MDB8799284.1 hypothetical protein [Romboutsia sp. 1001216sp1]MDB8802083.1 hypothetical protein [Romboutsia sp. 1001216sp1]MDB8804715.1 hypothetical protein [Romboutsia sp. 1001216sp1]